MKKDVNSMKGQMIELQKSIADSNLRMEEMSNSIFILQEQAKANKEALKQVSQPKIYIQNDNPAEQVLGAAIPMPLPQGGVPTAGYGTDNIKGSVGAGIPVSNSGLPNQGEFSAALSGFQKQNYGLAVFDFTSFLTKNPDSPQAELALYYLGMSYFKLNEFGQAVREWNKLITRHPSGARASEATYLIGVSYNSLADRSRAKTYFDLVIQKYPSTDWAQKAASALKQ